MRCLWACVFIATSAAGDIAVLEWCSFGVLRGFRGLRSGRVRCLWATMIPPKATSYLGGQRYRRFCPVKLSPLLLCSVQKVAWHLANVINPTFCLISLSFSLLLCSSSQFSFASLFLLLCSHNRHLSSQWLSSMSASPTRHLRQKSEATDMVPK